MDEAALIEALASGHVRAASLDVFAEEPLSGRKPRFGTSKNLYITPHIGGLITYADYDRLSTEGLSRQPGPVYQR